MGTKQQRRHPFHEDATAALSGRVVRVHRNLSKAIRGRWSVTDPGTGLVICHCDAISLADVSMHVSEASRQRVIRQRRKNVHARVQGTVSDPPPFTGHRWQPAGYDPYTCVSFTCGGLPISRASFALLSAGGLSLSDPS